MTTSAREDYAEPKPLSQGPDMRILQILGLVSCYPYRIKTAVRAEGVIFRLSWTARDVGTGMTYEAEGRRHLIDYMASEDQIVKLCLAACLAVSEHEVRERFIYRGKQVFDPHLPVT